MSDRSTLFQDLPGLGEAPTGKMPGGGFPEVPEGGQILFDRALPSLGDLGNEGFPEHPNEVQIKRQLKDPEETEAKIELSQYLAGLYEQSPDAVWDHYPTYAKPVVGDQDSKNVLANFKDLFRYNWIYQKIGVLRGKQLLGDESEETAQEIAQLKASLPNIEKIKQGFTPEFVKMFQTDIGVKGPQGVLFKLATIAATRKELKEEVPEAFPSPIERTPYALANTLPSQLSTLKEGLIGAGMGALIGGGIGLATTGPGALPAALKGAGTGYSVASGAKMALIEAGLAYDAMLEEELPDGTKLNPKAMKGTAIAVGIVSGALEGIGDFEFIKHTGLNRIVGRTIAEKLTRNLIADKSGDVLSRALARHAGFVTKETMVEVAQETSQILGDAVVKEVTNKVDGTEFEQDWSQAIPQIAKTIENSVLAFNVMGSVGTMRAVLRPGEKAQATVDESKAEPASQQPQGPSTEEAIKILRENGLDSWEIEDAVKNAFGENSQRYKETREFFIKEDLQTILPQSKEELMNALSEWGGDMLATKKGVKNDTKMRAYGLSSLWKAAALGAARGHMKDSLYQRLQKEINNNPEKYQEVFADMLGDDRLMEYFHKDELVGRYEPGTTDWFAENLKTYFPNMDEDQLDASMSLIEARAAKLGMTADDYISQYIGGFTERMPEGALTQEEVYHGGPYAFDKFSTEAVGSGEGAAAFGWGLYFTSEENIAKFYAENIATKTPPQVIYDGRVISSTDVQGPVVDIFDTVVFSVGRMVEQKNVNPAVAKTQIQAYYERDLRKLQEGKKTAFADPSEKNIATMKKYIEAVKEVDPKKIELPKKRNLYKATLFKDREANWLDWEKMAPEKIVKSLKEKYGFNYIDGPITGQELYRALESWVANEGLVGERPGGASQAASELLLDEGIDGIRYPTGTLSGAGPEGSGGYNYVVFDEDAVQIDEHTQYQKTKQGFAKAAVEFTDEGKALIYASEQADFSSFVHEMGHVFENEMSDEERGAFRKWLGVKPDEEWTREAREKFADGFEQYLREGKAPNSQISDLFERFKEWLSDIYDRFSKYRMPKKVQKAYESLITPNPREASKQLEESWEAIKDTWLGNRDVRIHQAKTEAARFQDRIKALTGVKGYRQYNQEARDVDQAIQIYIDLKANPEHREQFYDQLTDRQKKIVDLSQNLNPEFIAIADEIAASYKEIGLEALDEDVIYNVRENYAARKWKLEGGRERSETFRKFGTKTGHRKARVFETILEGWANGYELSISSATQNLATLKEELVKVIVNKQFMRAMQGIKLEDGSPLLTTKRLEGYKEIEHPNLSVWKWAGKAEEGESYGKNFFITEDGDLFERQRMYAPEKQAKELNNILGSSKLNEVNLMHAITRFNAHVKAWVLQSSLFHHLAFGRSYLLGTGGKKLKELNVFKARSEGLEAIRNDDPIIVHAVRNGLTLGVMQDWQEALLHEKTIIGKVAEKTEMTSKMRDWVIRMREAQARRLFEIFGAGLKAKAFMIEYRNHRKKHPNLTPDEAAKHVANLINDDFGGLHLERMGRSPTAQHLFRLFILAPDWTESNVRTMVKSFKKGEEGQLYRKFWAGILLKGISATVLANFLLSGGDLDEFLDKYQKAWEAGEDELLHIDIKKLTAVDITGLYKLLGGETERRKYFNIMGHFMDPFKFIAQPFKSLHHKGSMIYGMLHEAVSGVDWAGRRFTTVSELMQTGESVTWDYGKGGPVSWSKLPSYILNTLVGMQPVQIQNLIAYLAGETEAFDALGQSLGLGITSTYEPVEKKNKSSF